MNKEDLGFSPRDICFMKRCPEPTVVRLTESEEYKGKRTRKDLCMTHGKVAKQYFGDKVDVVAVWNGATLEDFEND